MNLTLIFSSVQEKTLDDLVPLYIITPTYPRPEQLAELTRMSQTLMVRPKRILAYFIRGCITVQLTSYLTGLDSTKLVNLYLIQHKQSIFI